MRLRRAIAASDAGNVEVQLELVRCELQAMVIEGVAGSEPEALNHLGAALSLLESLTRKGHGEHPAVQQIKESLAALATSERSARPRSLPTLTHLISRATSFLRHRGK